MVTLIIGALPRSLVHFRGPLIKAMLAKGLKVFAAANGRDKKTQAQLLAMGVEYYPIRIARAGMNPFADVVTLFDLIRLMRRVRPDVVLSYTIKPVIWGGFAARLCGVQQVFSLIEGLGRAFLPWESFAHMISTIVAKGLYRMSSLGSTRVFFLNPDDLNQFVKEGYIPERKAVLLNGIGIDLTYYAKEQFFDPSRVRFLMIARLLKDKGVREYVEAAKIIRARYGNVKFVLAGDLDENPSSIKQTELDMWRRDGIIECVGYLDDVRPFIRDCGVYVLPSYYREGTPRTILEAMATGRAIITTDAPGCRETVPLTETGRRQRAGGESVMEGENGFMVRPRDAEAVAAAMRAFLDNPALILRMGQRSREIAVGKYDVHKVNAVMMEAMGFGK